MTTSSGDVYVGGQNTADGRQYLAGIFDGTFIRPSENDEEKRKLEDFGEQIQKRIEGAKASLLHPKDTLPADCMELLIELPEPMSIDEVRSASVQTGN